MVDLCSIGDRRRAAAETRDMKDTPTVTIEERLTRIEQTLESIVPVISALGKLLVRSHEAGKALDLGRDTLTKNTDISQYEEVGRRRTFVEVGEISVIKKRRKKR